MPEATVLKHIDGLGGTDFRVGERVVVESEDGERFTVKSPTGYRVMVGVPGAYLTIDPPFNPFGKPIVLPDN